MANTQVDRRRGRGRRPARQLRDDILDATCRLLFEHGFAAVSFEKVASETPCSKVTLYKWWTSPGALAAEAYFMSAAPVLRFPDTGDVARDLSAQLHGWVRLLSDEQVGHAITGLVGAAQTDPELAAAWSEHYSKPRRQLAVDRLESAKSAGEIASDVDLQVVVDQLWGACYHRLLIPDEPLTREFADALVKNLLRGISA